MPLPPFPDTDIVPSGSTGGPWGTSITPAGDHKKNLVSSYTGVGGNNAVSMNMSATAWRRFPFKN